MLSLYLLAIPPPLTFGQLDGRFRAEFVDHATLVGKQVVLVESHIGPDLDAAADGGHQSLALPNGRHGRLHMRGSGKRSHGKRLLVAEELRLTVDGVENTYREGDSFFIPAGAVHGAVVGAGYRAVIFFDQADRYQAK